MSNLTLPNPEVPISTCPHCGAEVKISTVWYQKFIALLALINANLP